MILLVRTLITTDRVEISTRAAMEVPIGALLFPVWKNLLQQKARRPLLRHSLLMARLLPRVNPLLDFFILYPVMQAVNSGLFTLVRT